MSFTGAAWLILCFSDVHWLARLVGRLTWKVSLVIRGVRIEFPNVTRTCNDSPCKLPFLCCSYCSWVVWWHTCDMMIWHEWCQRDHVSLLAGGRARVGQAHECWMMLDAFHACASCLSSLSCLAMNLATQMLPMFLGFCKLVSFWDKEALRVRKLNAQ